MNDHPLFLFLHFWNVFRQVIVAMHMSYQYLHQIILLQPQFAAGQLYILIPTNQKKQQSKSFDCSQIMNCIKNYPAIHI